MKAITNIVFQNMIDICPTNVGHINPDIIEKFTKYVIFGNTFSLGVRGNLGVYAIDHYDEFLKSLDYSHNPMIEFAKSCRKIYVAYKDKGQGIINKEKLASKIHDFFLVVSVLKK